MSPAAFSANLLKCVKNDWLLDLEQLAGLIPSLAKVTGSVWGAQAELDFLTAEARSPRQRAPSPAAPRPRTAALRRAAPR
jgi:hypothetical protein